MYRSRRKVLSRHHKAVEEFQRAVLVHPSAENLCLLSESLHAMGDAPASLSAANRAIAINPHEAKAYVRRGQCYASAGALAVPDVPLDPDT